MRLIALLSLLAFGCSGGSPGTNPGNIDDDYDDTGDGSDADTDTDGDTDSDSDGDTDADSDPVIPAEMQGWWDHGGSGAELGPDGVGLSGFGQVVPLGSFDSFPVEFTSPAFPEDIEWAEFVNEDEAQVMFNWDDEIWSWYKE